MTTLLRMPATDCGYQEFGPYVTTATVTGCSWAFTAADAQPTGPEWVPGVVEQDIDDQTRYLFRILVSGSDPGGGNVTLAGGGPNPEAAYRVWLQVAASPELDVFPIGTLTVY